MESAPPVSTAVVATDRPDRYAKQLAAHLARRLDTTWDDATRRGVVRFDGGRCDLLAGDDGLHLELVADAPDPTQAASAPASTELVTRMEDVVGRHLVRFGTRDELVVAWRRSDGTEGGVFRHTDEPDASHER